MKPLYLAVVALSLTAAVAHAQPAPADGAQQPANRAETIEAAGRVDRAQSKQEDPNACVGPVSFCNVYFGS
ncbi:hypothetical protein [Burkholderia vietnamiensis]|jgi:hypothetical protein|uniref:hypothetical protein n=1 Tax=Burkholderia vietnamiensis TaxID=60552 RepID=UPI00075EA97D|nr:hypothetical protein [Burkholderia vietnamiensis]AOJ15795.1 hypothetical protein WJ02_19540 [Burkholderia vietnamiensis]KVE31664.1 hypothetical protein WI93_28885 [Burkholderia vietnamiensis]KVE60891.1 hypothetical protein WI94_27610 [Burkholderia vietnamiensis]KVE65289.1 hypothetical protein WI97_15810 [Burkholderia vietnamiensis]KVE70237.1 hypothetical protein WI98_28535 [Burkholderia vietnamiensis]